jgi:hypothetical protein
MAPGRVIVVAEDGELMTIERAVSLGVADAAVTSCET